MGGGYGARPRSGGERPAATDVPLRRPAAARARRRVSRLALGLGAVALALTAPVALRAAALAPSGATFLVDTTADAVDASAGDGLCRTAAGTCSLRAAVQAANALAGADRIEVPAGTYALAIQGASDNAGTAGDLDVTGPVEIVGAGAAATIVDAGSPAEGTPARGMDRLFEVAAGAGSVTISGLTLREGFSKEYGGAILNAGAATLRLAGVTISDSYAAKYGGGIANQGGGRVELVGSTLTGNGAKEAGGAIHNHAAGTVAITTGSEVVDNPGTYPLAGAAVNNEGEGDTLGTIEIVDSTVSRNEASSNGGGVRNTRDGRIVVERSTLSANSTSASGGAIYSVSGVVLVRSSTLSGNSAGSDISSGDGGGIYNAGQLSKAGTPGRVEVTGSTVSGNSARGDGGGLHSGLEAELVLADSAVVDNHADGEGGGASTQAKADMTVARVTFSGNSADVAGGGALVYAEGATSFTDVSFVENAAGTDGGGGLATDGKGTIDILRSTFTDNTAIGDGGGMSISSEGGQTVVDSTVADNTSEANGGGIANSGMLVTFLRVTVSGNGSVGDGGGIFSEGSGQLDVVDSVVDGNTGENGGGFASEADGTMEISGSTFSNNTARLDGGGYLEVSDANASVVNSTFSGNRAGDRGGGVYTNADAELRIVNATITDNTALSGSGFSTSVESLNFPVVPATAVFLRNTLVGGNHDGINCHGAVFSEGGNLDDGTTCFFSHPTDITRSAPGLEPLADTGGATRTHMPLSSSFAVDHGVQPCPEADQRGVSRPKNAACDIGAVEFEGVPTPPSTNPLPPPTGPDSDPPEVTIDAAPPARTLETTAEFRFRADELARFECVLNPPVASFSGCESPHDYTNVTLGLQAFQVRAIDAAGNVGQAETYTWRVVEELVPPETTIGAKPADPTKVTTATFTFGANEAATFECKLDDGEAEPCSSPYSRAGLGEGLHSFEVVATDTSFNPDETPATYTWTIDTTAPATTIDGGPTGPTNDPTPEFAFSASEAGVTFACRVDAGAFAACGSPFTSLTLADAAHTFEVRATDAAGNAGAAASASFTVDTIEPETTIGDGPAALVNRSTVTFSFSSEAGATFACALDGAPFTSCASPHELHSLGDGEHTFAVRASDGAGNVEATAASRTFTVDTTPPDIAIGLGPASLTAATSASFTFTATEPATFECSLDGAPYAACASPAELAALADGPHTFRVRATDAAGNTDPDPASHTWTVDTTPPDTTIVGGPDGPVSDTTPELTFTSEAGATFECSLDGGAFASCSSPFTAPPLAEGAHAFAVRATDAAGNTDQTPAERSFTVDLTAPVTSIGAGPDALTRDASATFHFSSNETGSTFECSLDSAAFASCSSPATYSGLADGGHTFAVRATDAAGNTDGTPADASWTVDATAPETEIIGAPTGLVPTSSAEITFSATEVATFQCSLDAAAFTSCTSPRLYAALGDGAHTFEVRATDAAGNTDSSPASASWTVDTAAPVTSIDGGPASLTADSTPIFTFAANEAATFRCRVDDGILEPCTSPHTTTALADGAHTFEVVATDTAGNVDATPATSSFTVDTTPPDTAIGSGPSALTNERTPTFTFSSEDGATFECSLDAGVFAACTTPASYGPLADGGHTFQVRATDGAGNTDETPAARTWTIDTTPPDTTITSGPAGSTDQTSATFTFATNDPTAPLECRLDGAAFAPCPTGTASYAGLGLGTHTFDVRATDASANTGSASRTWTIVPPADTTAPAITLVGPPAETSDTSATFTFSANEPATFECTLDGAAQPTCSSPLTRAGLALGAHTFRVEATDAAGNTGSATHSWTITVAPDSTPPVVTISGPSATTTSTSATFTFSANEPATFECALDAAAFAGCTSPQSYSGLALGQHVFRVRATDGASNTSTTEYSWTITDGQAPIVTITSGPATETSQTTATFAFSANEPVTGFSCSLDGGAFTTCTSPHQRSGLAVGPHTFQVRATDLAGNSGLATSTWTIVPPPDTSPPVVTITSAPASSTTATSASFSFSANEPATFTCALDAGTPVSCASPAAYSALAAGSHTFRVEARDAAGNTGAATYSWTVLAPGGCASPGTVTLGANADTWILQSSATSNYGGDSAIKVDTKSGSNARVLVRFTLPALPAGCTVTSATLRLYAGSYKTGRTLQALALASAWGESSVTWSNQPATRAPAATVASGGGYRDWSVGALVAGMYASGNNGFLVRDSVEDGNGVEQAFHSREKDADNPPQLVVTFG